jgi:two-component system LytT family sensor kinase
VHEVTLAEELRILDLYLEIERARFDDRLRVQYNVPASLRGATVPNLVLQPLVENSIRHGVNKRAAPGWITVSAEAQGEMLVLRVTDNGAGFDETLTTPVRHGIGLAITRGRLESLYGTQQSLLLTNLPAGGVEAKITIPFRTEAAGNEIDRENHVELQGADR